MTTDPQFHLLLNFVYLFIFFNSNFRVLKKKLQKWGLYFKGQYKLHQVSTKRKRNNTPLTLVYEAVVLQNSNLNCVLAFKIFYIFEKKKNGVLSRFLLVLKWWSFHCPLKYSPYFSNLFFKTLKLLFKKEKKSSKSNRRCVVSNLLSKIQWYLD